MNKSISYTADIFFINRTKAEYTKRFLEDDMAGRSLIHRHAYQSKGRGQGNFNMFVCLFVCCPLI